MNKKPFIGRRPCMLASLQNSPDTVADEYGAIYPSQQPHPHSRPITPRATALQASLSTPSSFFYKSNLGVSKQLRMIPSVRPSVCPMHAASSTPEYFVAMVTTRAYNTRKQLEAPRCKSTPLLVSVHGRTACSRSGETATKLSRRRRLRSTRQVAAPSSRTAVGGDNLVIHAGGSRGVHGYLRL